MDGTKISSFTQWKAVDILVSREPTAFGCYELQPTLKALQSDRMLNPMAQLHETRNRFPLQGAIG